MQQIYRQSNKQFEVYTTVFSPQVCRSRTKTIHVDTEKVKLYDAEIRVVVAVTQYRARWPKELDLKKGDLVRVLFKEDETWWFGRLTDGNEGYFPITCVEPLQGGDLSGATPTMVRRGSVPVVVTTAGAPCGCTSGRSTPKLLRRNSNRRPPGPDGSTTGPGPLAAHPHDSPSLLHRVLTRSRRKSYPHLSHHPLENGSINTAFQLD